MGLIGLFQDLLRLRKRVCVLYLAPPMIFFLIAVPVELVSGPAGRHEPLGRGLVYMAFFGLSLLIGLFVVPVVSCVVGLVSHFTARKVPKVPD
jgi:Na+/H+-dicarboxylate symporter